MFRTNNSDKPSTEMLNVPITTDSNTENDVKNTRENASGLSGIFLSLHLQYIKPTVSWGVFCQHYSYLILIQGSAYQFGNTICFMPPSYFTDITNSTDTVIFCELKNKTVGDFLLHACSQYVEHGVPMDSSEPRFW